jgi:pyruvate dehydrogenase E2 component (dihydrolipoamide acetyltransferase)
MEIKLPALGENVNEAEVLTILVKKGDTVQKDQPILEMESEKATFEVPAPQSGTVSEVHVAKGAKVGVGQTILTLEEGKEPPAESKEGAKTETAGPVRREPEAAAAEDEAKKPEHRKQAATEEADASKPAPAKPATPPKAREEPPAEAAEAPPEKARVAAGPATRRLARELRVDLTQVRGTEAGGRITTEDLKRHVRERTGRGPAAPEAPDFAQWGEIERRPLSAVEKTAAHRLSQSWREVPHVTHHDLADVTELEQARERYEANRKPSEPKMTMTALAVKAAVAALRQFPQCNASLDAAREELVLKRYVHIGVAVDTEHGLLVPVVRDADRKTTRQIAAEIAALAERARQRKLGPEDMLGASFTVTNLGGIGGIGFTPIVSFPEVAILGLSRTREELRMRSGQVTARLTLPLSLSYDHRAVNGADAARFVRHLASLLEDPVHLLMES